MAEAQTIEDLPGVGSKVAEKLKTAGYVDMMSLAVASVKELVEVTLSTALMFKATGDNKLFSTLS